MGEMGAGSNPFPGRAAAFFTLLRRAGTLPSTRRPFRSRFSEAALRKGCALHRARETESRLVMRGLDPRIHRSSKRAFRSGWIAGSNPGNDAAFLQRQRFDYSQAEEKPMSRPAIHPGEILADELNELEITPTELSRQISVPPNRISQII